MQESAMSKHVCLEGDLPTSPNNFIIEKKKSVEECQDISAVDLSRKDVMIDNLKTAVAQVSRNGKQGNPLSLSIMEEIDPEILSKLTKEDQKGNTSPAMAEIQIID